MDHEPTARPRRPRPRPLASPVLALALGLTAVVLIGAILLIPGLLPGSSATEGPTCPGTRPACQSASGSEQPSSTPTTGPSLTFVAPTFVHPTPTPLPTFITYVVKAGDSLNTIAHQYKTTARSIAWWNRGTYPNLDPEAGPNYSPGHIEPGWVLVLIPGVTVDDNNPPTPSPGPPTATPGPPSVSPSPSGS